MSGTSNEQHLPASNKTAGWDTEAIRSHWLPCGSLVPGAEGVNGVWACRRLGERARGRKGDAARWWGGER